MSRESGSDQPGQRTVADLLAQYGTGQPPGGRRRRRRRAEDDEDGGAQQIIDRVRAESGRHDPVAPDPDASDAAQDGDAPAAADAAARYHRPPVTPAGPEGADAPDDVRAAPDDEAPTGILDRVDDRPGPPSAAGRRRSGASDHRSDTETPRGRRRPPAHPEPLSAAATQHLPPIDLAAAHPFDAAADKDDNADDRPRRGKRGRPGSAAADAQAGRAAARASWPLGGLSEPVADGADPEPMTEQFPAVGPDARARTQDGCADDGRAEGTAAAGATEDPDDLDDLDANALDDTTVGPPVRPGTPPAGFGGPGWSDTPADPERTVAWHSGTGYDFAAAETQFADTEFPHEEFEQADRAYAARRVVDAMSDAPAADPEAEPGADTGTAQSRTAGDSAAATQLVAQPAATPADLELSFVGWLLIAAQLVGGLLGGAALWLAFQYLWEKFPPVAAALATAVTAGLVFLARLRRPTADRQTLVVAILAGLVVTATPAAFLLVGA